MLWRRTWFIGSSKPGARKSFAFAHTSKKIAAIVRVPSRTIASRSVRTRAPGENAGVFATRSTLAASTGSAASSASISRTVVSGRRASDSSSSATLGRSGG